MDSNDNVHITWSGIYYIKLDKNGTTLVDAKRLTPDDLAFSILPAIAVDLYDDIHITWQDYQDYRDYEIYYMKLDNEGHILINDTRLSNDQIDSFSPKIAVDSDNNVHITWCDLLPRPSQTRQEIQIYPEYIHYIKLDSNGSILVDDTKLSTGTSPAIAVDSDNNVHITWDDNRSGNYEIYYTKLDSDGNTLIDDTRLTYDSASSVCPAIAVNSNNKAHITWYDWRDGNPEIYYKRQR